MNVNLYKKDHKKNNIIILDLHKNINNILKWYNNK